MVLLEEGVKMDNKYYVGIDTSAYTTSLAVVDDENNIVLDLRKVLEVEKGKLGLRQQEAVFQHINNLPALIGEMTDKIDISKIETIACSSRPRNVEGSYMPVFVVGKGQAFILSKILGSRYKEYSHQEGHIGAGMIAGSIGENSRFISLHISGGTTELLLVHNLKERLKIDILGGSLDLSMGQLIDRIGVELGLPFPCGENMDRMAQKGNILDIKIPIKIKDGTWFNLSGMENFFKKLIHSHKYETDDILATLFNTMADFIFKIIINSSKEFDIDTVLITGGVSANKIIRKYLMDNLASKGIKVLIPDRRLCTDNAIGIAFLGKEKD